jgi:hypothetical protein
MQACAHVDPGQPLGHPLSVAGRERRRKGNSTGEGGFVPITRLVDTEISVL